MANHLLQSTLFWLASALAFELFLKKLTLHRANRIWLLATAAVGLVWPFFQQKMGSLLIQSRLPVAVLPAFEVGGIPVGGTAQTSGGSGFSETLWLVWAVGFAVGLGRLAFGLWQIYRKTKTGQIEPLPGGFRLVRSPMAARPFSFFRLIFIDNSLNINDLGARQILTHEQAHGRMGHGFDLLFIGLFGAAFWFHPFAHWLRRRLVAVHEFEADEAAATQFSRKSYGNLLLDALATGPSRRAAVSVTNSFFSSPIKSRIMMLSQKKSGPVASGSTTCWCFRLERFCCFSSKKAARADGVTSSRNWKMTEAIDTVVTFNPETYKETVEYLKTPIPKKAESDDATVFYKEGDEMPEFPGGQAAFARFLGQNIKYPAEARKAGVQGTQMVSFVVDESGAAGDFMHAGDYFNLAFYKEAERVLKLMPRWKPGKIGNRSVRMQVVVPVKFRLE